MRLGVLCSALCVWLAGAAEPMNSVGMFTLAAEFGDVEKQALNSWRQYFQGSQIVVFVPKKELCPNWEAAEAGLKCVLLADHCVEATFHRPLMHCIFQQASQHLDTDWLMFVHADVAFEPGAQLFGANWATYEDEIHTRLFYMGSHRDASVPDLASSKDALILASTIHTGRVIDYFVYHRDAFPLLARMPPFLHGVWLWDAWVILMAQATPTLKLVDVSDCLVPRPLAARPAVVAGEEAVYNRRHLLKALRFCKWACLQSLARIVTTDYKMVNSATGPQLVIRGSNLTLQAWRQCNRYGMVLLMALNSALMNLFMNWRCFARRIGLRHYIIFAGDTVSYEQLLALGEPVVPLESLEDLFQPGLAGYGSLRLQKLLLQRTELAAALMKQGFQAILANPDGMFLQDPMPFFVARSCSLGSESRACQCTLRAQTDDGAEISGGLLSTTIGRHGLTFWAQVLACQTAVVDTLQKARPEKEEVEAEPTEADLRSPHSEVMCIKNTTAKREELNLLTVCLLPARKFVDSARLFTHRRPLTDGRLPVAVHMNWLANVSVKVDRLKEWGLWLLDHRDRCVWERDAFGTTPADGGGWPNPAFRLKVRVLAGVEPDRLERLLASLAAAQYDDERVELEVLVPAAAAAKTAALKAARAFAWAHGPYKVQEVPGPANLDALWLYDPELQDDGHALLLLDENVVVAKSYYLHVRHAARAYSVNATTHDPRLYGLSLQRQQLILAGPPKSKRNTIEKLLPRGAVAYLYQLVGSYAQLFFRRPWSRFLRWRSAVAAAPVTALRQCAPVYIPKHYALATEGVGGIPWRALFSYWVFREGLYNLYYNPKGSIALQHGALEAGKLEAMPTAGDPPDLPSRRALPLYDYHFERIPHRETLVLRSRLFHSLLPKEPCAVFNHSGPP